MVRTTLNRTGFATATVVTSETFIVSLDIVGIAELQSENFELMTVALDGEQVITATATGLGLGCEMGSSQLTKIVPGPYVLDPGEHAFPIDFTTNDPLFHVGAFYELNLNFIPAFDDALDVSDGQDGDSMLDWSNNEQQISQYFTVGEVTLMDVRRQPEPGSEEEQNILALAKELDKVRADWNSPIVVTSWYRPPDVNAEVGGAADSQHIYGRAADIKPQTGDVGYFQTWLDTDWYGALGKGAAKGFVHVDTRNGKGWKTGGEKGTRWTY